MSDPVVIVPLKIVRKHSNGNVEVYRKREELGKGGFATVFRVTNEETGESFALKATSRQILAKPKVMQKHRSEVAIQRSLDHPFITKLYDFFEDSVNTYMVLELCPGKSVRDLLKRKNILNEQETVSILHDVIEGLCYLHDNRIIHRDLKLENFFIGADGRVRIGDFGLSAKLDFDDEKKYTVCGTPNYLSPELLIPGSHGHRYEVDIWAIGVCAFAMLTGRAPFETRHKSLTYEHIKNCQYHFPAELNISFQAKSFIRSILQINPELRPSAYELLQHPFMTRNTGIERLPCNNLAPVERNPICAAANPIIAETNYVLEKEQVLHERNHVVNEWDAPISERNLVDPERKQRAIDINFIPERVPLDVIRKPRNENIVMNNDFQKKPLFDVLQKYEQISMPDFCVSRFCDHSEKYGLGYLLINGSVGACFNDSTRMVMDPYEEFIQYWENYQDPTPQVLRKDDHSQFKKISLLLRFSESLKKTKTMFFIPDTHLDKFIPLHHVKYWVRNDDATLFRMDDRNIQLNFNDRTKLVIFWQNKQLMTVSNIKEKGCLVPLDDLMKHHELENQRKRFMIAKRMVAEMSSS